MSYNLKTLAKIWRDGNNRGNKIGITALGKYGNYYPPIPTGLIVPYNDVSAPDGWSLFTSANGKHIVGAGNTYSVAATGGGTSLTIGQSSGSGGAHTGYPPSFESFRWWDGASAGMADGTATSSSHTHSISSVTFTPKYQSYILIKSQDQLSEFPQNAIVLGGGSFSGLSNVSQDNRYLMASNSIGQGGSATTSGSLSAGGLHDHGATDDGWPLASSDSGYDTIPWTEGNHGGTVSNITITDNIKKVLLSIWTNASANFGTQSNMIAMWEGVTAPDGWILCDGNNSTPDLRDYFINMVNSGSENTVGSGNNTVDFDTGTINHSASHHHKRNSISGYNLKSVYHDTNSWSHSHSAITKLAISFLPPYYALTLIMKT